MARASNTKLVSYIDCPGGGQVTWDRDILYVSHMRPPDGTSIYDVADPRHPKLIAKLEVPIGWHSHKVRAANGLMVVNYEKFREGAPEFGGGIGIYDVSNPAKPRLVAAGASVPPSSVARSWLERLPITRPTAATITSSTAIAAAAGSAGSTTTAITSAP